MDAGPLGKCVLVVREGERIFRLSWVRKIPKGKSVGGTGAGWKVYMCMWKAQEEVSE